MQTTGHEKRGTADMGEFKLPIALVLAMSAQLAGGVWWVSQQAATISSLEETVSQLGSKMAIEENVNLKRDVSELIEAVDYIWAEIDEVWDDTEGLAMSIMDINGIKQRLTAIETELKYIVRDHTDPRGK